jgi:hypothetical protein
MVQLSPVPRFFQLFFKIRMPYMSSHSLMLEIFKVEDIETRMIKLNTKYFENCFYFQN